MGPEGASHGLHLKLSSKSGKASHEPADENFVDFPGQVVVSHSLLQFPLIGLNFIVCFFITPEFQWKTVISRSV